MKKYIPIPKWNEHHDWPPPGGMRHIRFHSDKNGFSRAFKKVGRIVLVDEEEFWKIVEEQNKGAA